MKTDGPLTVFILGVLLGQCWKSIRQCWTSRPQTVRYSLPDPSSEDSTSAVTYRPARCGVALGGLFKSALGTIERAGAQVVIPAPARQQDRPQRILNMRVYAGSDLVSKDIIEKGVYEPTDTNRAMAILAAAGAPVNGPGRADAASLSHHSIFGNSASHRPLLLDVGANIGWFSLNAAARNYDVIAFEPFARNVFLLKETMCAPENIRIFFGIDQRISLYNMGLGLQPQRCELWQVALKNFGDTHTVCPDMEAEARRGLIDSGYERVGDMVVGTLDHALAENVFSRKVDLMKMDVEGYEPHVLAGGRRFFESEFAPRRIVMEVLSKNLVEAGMGDGGAAVVSELKLLLDYGYAVVVRGGRWEGGDHAEEHAEDYAERESAVDTGTQDHARAGVHGDGRPVGQSKDRVRRANREGNYTPEGEGKKEERLDTEEKIESRWRELGIGTGLGNLELVQLAEYG